MKAVESFKSLFLINVKVKEMFYHNVLVDSS